MSCVFESVEDGAITLQKYVYELVLEQSCDLPRLDEFHRVDVHVDSSRQVSAYGQTQKCSCQGMISVEDV